MVFGIFKLENVLGHPLVSFFSVIAENDDTSLRDFLPLSQNIASITKLFNSNKQKLWVSSGGSSLKSTGHGSSGANGAYPIIFQRPYNRFCGIEVPQWNSRAKSSKS